MEAAKTVAVWGRWKIDTAVPMSTEVSTLVKGD